ncbi:MAG: DNA-directed RNA polymerase subunit beta, partial [Kordiimonadaceae bacterium]|nr:DNA-directed RNA polymerase subunit beta [Kordiimonadaceae bacterium]
MATSYSSRKKVRKNFGRIREVAEMPNLIKVQKSSYDQFLQTDVERDDRTDNGLQGVFKSVFPIADFAETASLEFVSYELEKPKYDTDECQQRDITYAAPLRVTLRLIVFEIDEETEARSVLDIKEQDVYMGDLPLMTDRGTFVVNGTERVIVSQMHRSPGVFFDHDKGKTQASGKFLFSARVIPYRGSWLDFEFDAKDIIHVRFDRRRKMPVTTLLYALGLSSENILDYYYDRLAYKKAKGGWSVPFDIESWRGIKSTFDLVDAKSGEVIVEAGKKITPRLIKKIEKEGIKNLLLPDEDLINRFAAEDMVNGKTGEIYIEAGEEITAEHLEVFADAGYKNIEVLNIDHLRIGPYLRNTLMADKCQNRDMALSEIYRVMRPGEPPTRETAEALFEGLFFDGERYDLSSVGRVKMNMRLDLDCPDDHRVLRKEDILEVLRTMIDLKDGKGVVDDIDHLGNRRVRSVGELMENQYRIGLLRMERAIRERMSSIDIDTVMPHDLVNAKPAVAAVREFFGSSQLSQFMDQTNPLSEITHKRRLSALGPGGLTRERAGFEVRDVHTTHYGRICPIETPEGPNIGLINSLATYAKVNKYGFIETPYRKVEGGKITDDVIYLSAMEEEKYTIAQANTPLTEKGDFAHDLVDCRQAGDHVLKKHKDISLMDVSPKQVVSVAAALIPFLENDDANRALMGSNMQRQAVPLLRAESPFVGTGMERVVARDSGAAVVAARGGVIDQVDAIRIVIRVTDKIDHDSSGVDTYTLSKF